MMDSAEFSAALERAMFDAMETSVRYHEGTASAVELAAANRRLRVAVALERRRLECNLFAIRARPERTPVAPGN